MYKSWLSHTSSLALGKQLNLPSLGFPIWELGTVNLPRVAGRVQRKKRHRKYLMNVSFHEFWDSEDSLSSRAEGNTRWELPHLTGNMGSFIHRRDSERQPAAFTGIRVVFSPPPSTACSAFPLAWGLGAPGAGRPPHRGLSLSTSPKSPPFIPVVAQGGRLWGLPHVQVM